MHTRAVLIAAFLLLVVLSILTLIRVRSAPMPADALSQMLPPPLHLAAQRGDRDQAAALIAAGADVNAKDRNDLTALQYAAQADHPEVVELLLTKGADANAEDRLGATPLYQAAFNNTAVVAVLLAHGADPDGHERFGRTPLSRAVYWGNLEAARLIVSHGGHYGYSPLLTAIAQGKAEEVKQVLDHDSTLLNAVNVDRVTPLYQAVTWGRWDIARLLLARGATADAMSDHGVRQWSVTPAGDARQGADARLTTFRSTETPLLQAMRLQNSELVLLLLHSGASANGTSQAGVTPLQQAVLVGNASLARTLLGAGADINAPAHGDNPPLFLAVSAGDTAMISLLLERGTDVRAKMVDGTTLLHVAAGADNLPLVTDLLARGLPVNAQTATGTTPLDMAIAGGPWRLGRSGPDPSFYRRGPSGPAPSFYGKVAVLLRKHGGYDGQTHTSPLLFFIQQGDVAGVREMLERHPGLAHAKGADGNTPIYWATQPLWATCTAQDRLNRERIMDALVEAGADPNSQLGISFTLLHEAVLAGRVAEARRLLDKGAHVDARDDLGRTPLYWAALQGAAPLVTLLISHGANVNARDDQGDPPLKAAVCFSHPTTADLLRQHGGIDDSRSALVREIMGGNLAGVSKILQTNPGLLRPSESNANPPLLFEAIFYDRPEVLTLLIARGADVNLTQSDGDTPLAQAVYFGKAASVAILKRHGALYGTSPLCDAVFEGDGPKAAALLAQTPSLIDVKDAYGWTPLHLAVRRQDHTMVRLLLEHHAAINEAGKDNMTPLEIAVYQGDAPTVSVLLEHGAEVNVSYMPGRTPLVTALGRHDSTVTALLRQHGAKQ